MTELCHHYTPTVASLYVPAWSMRQQPSLIHPPPPPKAHKKSPLPSIRVHHLAVILFPVGLLKPTTLTITYHRWFKIVTKMCLREKKPHITIQNSLILVPDSVPGQMMHTTVRDLSPWVDYEFRVVAINSVGVGEPSTHTKQIRTKAAGTLWFSCLSLCWFNHNHFPVV